MKASVTLQDIALVQMQGGTIGATVEYPGFSNRRNAERAAQRDLRALATPLLSCTIYCGQEAADLDIGDTFKFEWPDYHEGAIVMRVTGMAFGDGRTDRIRIDCVQDVFAAPLESILSEDRGSLWTNPSQPPGSIEEGEVSVSSDSDQLVAATTQIATEMPYRQLVEVVGARLIGDYLAETPDVGILQTTGKRPESGVQDDGSYAGNAINALIHVDAGSGYVQKGAAGFCGFARLSEDIGFLASSFTVIDAQDLSTVRIGTFAQIDDELVRVDSISGSTVTVGRGILDTVPAPHLAGASILFWQDFAGTNSTEYEATESINVKLQPRNNSGTASLASAIAMPLTFDSRAIRPYPPGNVKINGVAYPETDLGGAPLVVTWSHRDRLQQTGATFEDTTDGSIGPEAGTTYTVRLEDSLGNVITEETGITGTEWNEASDASETDNEIVVKLWSVRGAIASTGLPDWFWQLNGPTRWPTEPNSPKLLFRGETAAASPVWIYKQVGSYVWQVFGAKADETAVIGGADPASVNEDSAFLCEIAYSAVQSGDFLYVGTGYYGTEIDGLNHGAILRVELSGSDLGDRVTNAATNGLYAYSLLVWDSKLWVASIANTDKILAYDLDTLAYEEQIAISLSATIIPRSLAENSTHLFVAGENGIVRITKSTKTAEASWLVFSPGSRIWRIAYIDDYLWAQMEDGWLRQYNPANGSLLYETQPADGSELEGAVADIWSPAIVGSKIGLLGTLGSTRSRIAFDTDAKTITEWGETAQGGASEYASWQQHVIPVLRAPLPVESSEIPSEIVSESEFVSESESDVAGWTPAEITTAGWFDAADAGTITLNGSTVSQWDDKSGDLKHATQGTAGNQPTYTETDSVFNNNPSIGSQATSGLIGLVTPSLTAKTIYCVISNRTGTETAFINFDTIISGENSRGEQRIMGRDGTDDWYEDAFDRQFNDAGTFKNGSTTDTLLEACPMPATLFKFKSVVARTQQMHLGFNSSNSARKWVGAYGEFIFTDGTEDTATEQKIEGYLAWKWGIEANLPPGHPYENAAP